MIVYITTQGSRIIKEGRHLLVKKEMDTYNTLFLYKLEQVVIFGNVQITHSALSMFFLENIDVVFLRRDGRYLGRLETSEPKNIFLRLKQYKMAQDDSFRLKVARSIVSGKLSNMATLMARISRTRKNKETKKAAREIRNLSYKAMEAENLDQVMGYEGAGSGTYFRNLGHGLDGDWGFNKRIRRPPTDPVNAVLSFLYTLLINRAYASVRVAGLDPYPGTLHALEYGRHSLSLDLVEEFRTPVVDALTLSLFNLKVLKKDDFRIHEPQIKPSASIKDEQIIDRACQDPIGQVNMPEDSSYFDLPDQHLKDSPDRSSDGKMPVRLVPESLKRVITAFEKKINTEFYHPVAEKNLTYAESMVFQARLYRQVIEGEISNYQPLLLK